MGMEEKRRFAAVAAEPMERVKSLSTVSVLHTITCFTTSVTPAPDVQIVVVDVPSWIGPPSRDSVLDVGISGSNIHGDYCAVGIGIKSAATDAWCELVCSHCTGCNFTSGD